MPIHPGDNARLSSLGQAHKRLERRHRMFADSFKNRTPVEELTLEFITSAPAPIPLLSSQNYIWNQPLTGSFFIVSPIEAVVTYEILTDNADLPSGFTATITDDGRNISVGATSPFSGGVDVIVEATARYRGQTATATGTFRFSYDNPQVSISLSGSDPTNVALRQSSYTTTIDLHNHIRFSPASSVLTYEITSPPTNPNLTATLVGRQITFRNTADDGWVGSLPVTVTITATRLGASDSIDKRFSVNTTKAAPGITVTATTPLIQGTLVDAATDFYDSPRTIDEYFSVAKNPSLTGTPSVVYTIEDSPLPLTSTIVERSLPGVVGAAPFVRVETTSPFNGTRDVVVKATATLGQATGSATMTFRLSSPTAVAAPTIRTNRPSRPVTLTPDNNWEVSELLLQTSVGGVPTDPIYTPTDAEISYPITSGHYNQSHPRAQVINDGRSTPRIRLWSDSSQSYRTWTTPRIVRVRATAVSGGRHAFVNIDFPVSYRSLVAEAQANITPRVVIAGRNNLIDVKSFIRTNTGTAAEPSFSLRSRSFFSGGQNITLSSSGTVITLNPTTAAANTNHTLTAIVHVSYEGQTENIPLSIPIRVISAQPVISITPSVSLPYIKRTSTKITVILTAANNFIVVGQLPPAGTIFFNITPSTSTAQFSLGEAPPSQIIVGSPQTVGSAIQGSLAISASGGQYGPSLSDYPGGASAAAAAMAVYGYNPLSDSIGTFTLFTSASNQGQTDLESIRFDVIIAGKLPLPSES